MRHAYVPRCGLRIVLRQFLHLELGLGTHLVLVSSCRCHCLVLLVKVFEQLGHNIRFLLLVFIDNCWITEGFLDSCFGYVLNVGVDTTVAIHHADGLVAVRDLHGRVACPNSLIRLSVSVLWLLNNRLRLWNVDRLQNWLELNRLFRGGFRVESTVYHMVVGNISANAGWRLPVVDDTFDQQILVRPSLGRLGIIILLLGVRHIVISWLLLLDFCILLNSVNSSLMLFFLLKYRFFERTGDHGSTFGTFLFTVHWVHTHIEFIWESLCSTSHSL